MIGRPLVAMPLGVALVVGSCTAIDVPTGGGLPALVAPRLQVIPSLPASTRNMLSPSFDGGPPAVRATTSSRSAPPANSTNIFVPSRT